MSRLHGNAMVDDNGQVFFPDNPDDARYIEAEHHARPAAPDRWPWPCPETWRLYVEASEECLGLATVEVQCRRVAGHSGDHRGEVTW